jgi:hypothetical protein
MTFSVDAGELSAQALSDVAFLSETDASVAMDWRWDFLSVVSTKFSFNHPDRIPGSVVCEHRIEVCNGVGRFRPVTCWQRAFPHCQHVYVVSRLGTRDLRIIGTDRMGPANWPASVENPTPAKPYFQHRRR